MKNQLGCNGPLSIWVMKHFPEGYKGYAVDVGSAEGFIVNSTYWLEHHGWNVLNVEANVLWEPVLRKCRKQVEMCAAGAEDQDDVPFYVNPRGPSAYSSLDPRIPPVDHGRAGEPLRTVPPPVSEWSKALVKVRTVNGLLHKWGFPRLDLLAVDTEGTELDVLKGANLAKWQPKTIIVESWDDGETEMSRYLVEQGYRREARVAEDADNQRWLRE